jgi:hypothetical protein
MRPKHAHGKDQLAIERLNDDAAERFWLPNEKPRRPCCATFSAAHSTP